MSQQQDSTPEGQAFIYLLERLEPQLATLGASLMADVAYQQDRGEFTWAGDERALGLRLARMVYDGADVATTARVLAAVRTITARQGLFDSFTDVVVKAALAQTPAFLALLQEPAGSC